MTIVNEQGMMVDVDQFSTALAYEYFVIEKIGSDQRSPSVLVNSV